MSEVKDITIASDAPAARLYVLGNEAIARGAIEAGIDVVAAYPGTPSSEIVQAFIDASTKRKFYVDWSVNEKVAFEVAFAAAMSGLRSVAVMKHVGVNVAHDPLMTSAYMGTRGGFVLISADDPSMWSSQTEQDNRYIAMQAYVPVLEPTSGQEAREMMKDAILLSEKFGQMFMFRTVTRIAMPESMFSWVK
jgi:indolepyruvate ferredoxin oxidoreductase alpha subunit